MVTADDSAGRKVGHQDENVARATAWNSRTWHYQAESRPDYRMRLSSGMGECNSENAWSRRLAPYHLPCFAGAYLPS